MQIVLNGQPRALPSDTPLPVLVTELQLGERRVAVEVNGEIVPRSAWAQTLLRDGDRLEIVQAIGGG